MNCEGFLTPYRGVRYHLKEWGNGNLAPQNSRELFNLRHSKARNIIERTFGLLKIRWGILRDSCFYNMDILSFIILACALLHNFIRITDPDDPLESLLQQSYVDNTLQGDDDYIDTLDSSNAWMQWRDSLAMTWYNQWHQ